MKSATVIFLPSRLSSVFFAAASLVFSSSANCAGQTEEKVYRNIDYGYAVTLPSELTYDVNKAPNPNHGFRINMTPGITVWVDASSSDNPTLQQAVALERAIWERKNCRQVSTESKQLAGVRAAQITLECAAVSKEGIATSVRLLIALGGRRDLGPVQYTIGIQSPNDRTSRVLALEVFKAIQDGFYWLGK